VGDGTANRQSKYASLLEDPQVKRWYLNVSRGSRVTADVILRRLGKLCELLNMTPKEIVEKARSNLSNFQDMIEDMVASLEASGKSPGYVNDFIKTIRSWLRYNDIVLTRKIKISNLTTTPTIENEQVPTQEELSRILRRAKPRTKAAIALIAFSCLRPETLGNYRGTDGLRLRDLPELRVNENGVEFERVPTMVVVRPTLSKARHKYFTFLSQEGCIYLKEYLEERIRAGEKLGPDSPVIAHERKDRAKNNFLWTTNISDEIRECMRAAGVQKRPYVLRAYADTQLVLAESKGKISHPYLQFFAGHKGDIEARYSTNKGRLPPDMVEDMREAYRRCEPFLSTMAQPLEQTNVMRVAKIEALKAIAKNVFDLDLVEVRLAKETELGRDLSLDDELKLYEEELARKRKEADSIMNKLFEDPAFVDFVRQKMEELNKKGQLREGR
jgi:hypothetical protein